jgi:hypothetical protein
MSWEFGEQKTGYRVRGSGGRGGEQKTGYRVWGSGFKVQNETLASVQAGKPVSVGACFTAESRGRALKFKVQNSRLKIQERFKIPESRLTAAGGAGFQSFKRASKSALF